jgi:hypothetical protein
LTAPARRSIVVLDAARIAVFTGGAVVFFSHKRRDYFFARVSARRASRGCNGLAALTRSTCVRRHHNESDIRPRRQNFGAQRPPVIGD